MGLADAFSEGFDSVEEKLEAIRASSVSSNYKWSFHFIFKSKNKKTKHQYLIIIIKTQIQKHVFLKDNEPKFNWKNGREK